MSRLADVYASRSRWWSVARAAFLLAGSLVAAVGFVAATASLVAGFGLGTPGALRVAATLCGGLLLAGFGVLFARRTAGGRPLAVAVAGSAVALAGLAVFWTTLPAGWVGRLDRLPPLGIGAYGTGLLVVVGAWMVADPPADEKRASEGRGASGRSRTGTGTGGTDAERLGSVESVLTASGDQQGESAPVSGVRDEFTPGPAVGDGGEDEDDLRFFDDEGS